MRETRKVGAWYVVDEPSQDLSRQVGIAQAAPRLERLRIDRWQRDGDGQAAIGRQALQQNVAERLRRHAATGRLVFHVRLSTRRRVRSHCTKGKARMRAMASSTAPSRASCDRKIISASVSPCGCWNIDPMEMPESDKMRAISASTPGRSCTRTRR